MYRYVKNVLNYPDYSNLYANTAPNFNGLEKMAQKLPSIADPISKKCNIFVPYRTFLIEVQSFSKACIQDVFYDRIILAQSVESKRA